MTFTFKGIHPDIITAFHIKEVVNNLDDAHGVQYNALIHQISKLKLRSLTVLINSLAWCPASITA